MSPAQTCNLPLPSDSKNALLLSVDSNLPKVPTIQLFPTMFDLYHVIAFPKTKLKHPSRKFANNSNSNSNYRPKHQRTHRNSLPTGSDGVSNPPDENFAYQAGREFFLIHGPWIRSGDDLFDTNIVTHYNAVETFETDENMCQKWLRRQVSSIHMP
jgi:hypothetical protein